MGNLVNIPTEFTVNVKFERDSLITLATVVVVIIFIALLAQIAIKKMS